MGNAALLSLIALVPLVVLMLTSFVKVSVVLSLVRNAIGAPDAPSGLVIMGISLVLTFFVMAPVAIDMARAAATPTASPTQQRTGPTQNQTPNPNSNPTRTPTSSPSPTPAPTGAPTGGPVPAPPWAPTGGPAPAPMGAPSGGPTPAPTWAPSGGPAPTPTWAPTSGPTDLGDLAKQLAPQYAEQIDAATRAAVPLRAWLGKHAGERDKATFVELAAKLGRNVKGDELYVLAPAFLTTELRAAFAIAVLIFLPFLALDLIVGLGLAALGLQATSPQAVALPLKLLLFVAVDGWRLLVDALLRGYA